MSYLLVSAGVGTQHPNPLLGQLYMKGGLVYDQTGPRRVMFWSDFCLQRIVADDLPEAERSLDMGVLAGRHGVRLCLCGPSEDEARYSGFLPFPNHGYWWKRITTPALAREMLIPTLRMLAERDLYAHLFGSYNFGIEPGSGDWPAEREFHRWAASTIRKEGLGPRVGMFEWFNEWNLTSPYGGGWNEEHDTYGSDATYEHAAEAIAIWRNEIGCLCTMGSPGEDDPSIAETITRAGGNVAAIDFGRGYSGELMMKHAHRAYYDGRYHGKYKGAALWVTEPAGPDAPGTPDDSYLPLNDPAYLFGMHAIYAITGQACSYFNDPAVRHWQPPYSTVGFVEHPALFNFFPENIGLWTGPTWFLNPANQKEFYTVKADEWGSPDFEHPPAPIKRWQALFYDGTMVQDSGPITLPRTGWKAVALHGEFT